MDVNFITNVPYSIPRINDNGELIPGRIISDNKPELAYPLSNENSEAAKIREQMVMSLEQVQNFLFMLIGSKIRIHSENNSIGSIVNTVV